jgi:hypothetical protein
VFALFPSVPIPSYAYSCKTSIYIRYFVADNVVCIVLCIVLSLHLFLFLSIGQDAQPSYLLYDSCMFREFYFAPLFPFPSKKCSDHVRTNVSLSGTSTFKGVRTILSDSAFPLSLVVTIPSVPCRHIFSTFYITSILSTFITIVSSSYNDKGISVMCFVLPCPLTYTHFCRCAHDIVAGSCVLLLVVACSCLSLCISYYVLFYVNMLLFLHFWLRGEALFINGGTNRTILVQMHRQPRFAQYASRILSGAVERCIGGDQMGKAISIKALYDTAPGTIAVSLSFNGRSLIASLFLSPSLSPREGSRTKPLPPIGRRLFGPTVAPPIDLYKRAGPGRKRGERRPERSGQELLLWTNPGSWTTHWITLNTR